MKQRKLFLIISIVSAIILILFFLFNYKTKKYGNNISKSSDDIVESILNISSYEAKIEVIIESNKTTNKYQIKQLYLKPNNIKQIIEEPSNLANLTMIYDGKNMKVENSNLSLAKIYENYTYISQNTLWLSSFIDNYNDNSKIEEKDDELIIENNNIFNNYNVKQKLYVNKKTSLPIKLEIFDNNKNIKIYIKYNEIKLNKIKQNDIIAFRLKRINI